MVCSRVMIHIMIQSLVSISNYINDIVTMYNKIII